MTHHNSGRDRIGFYLIMTRQMSFDARISSRITTGIRVVGEYQINYNWFNEPYAVSHYKCSYLDMHGLIFETSVWLLAESTRLLSTRFQHSKKLQKSFRTASNQMDWEMSIAAWIPLETGLQNEVRCVFAYQGSKLLRCCFKTRTRASKHAPIITRRDSR